MKIKTKKQFTLPQLIEWGWSNPHLSRNKRFISENKEFPGINQYVIFNEVGHAEIENSYCYGLKDLFTVEVEEEITEDTKFNVLLVVDEDYNYFKYYNTCVDYFIRSKVKAIYIPNDDLTLTLIWRDGKLVE